jgi:hypothetical protein
LADTALIVETSHGWIIDSGAAQHMTNNKELLEDFQEMDSHRVTLAEKAQFKPQEKERLL